MLRIAFILLPFLAEGAKYDVQYWQGFEWTNWESGRFRLYTNGLTRITHDVRHFTYYRLTEAFAYRALDDLTLEIHYSYLREKTVSATHFGTRSRIELEANPHHKFKNGIKVQWRNRLELIKEQDRLHIQYVSRQRLTVVFPIKDCSPLKEVRIANEVFYNFGEKYFNQYRFYPIILNFEITHLVSLDTFVMIRTNRSSNKIWHRDLIFGCNLIF
ncbi:MAG: DUF2490 domain-containing protein [Parachlamydia sp.]|nr:DUF2490 domain-containing protein [Parachlamydia sp.]